MTKEEILDEIRRTAAENGGAAPGRRNFELATGIGQPVWYGRYWARWSDALKEAGFEPNAKQQAYSVRIPAIVIT